MLEGPGSGLRHDNPPRDVAPATRWILLFAALVAILSLFGPISASGIWDPHELRVADLSRRIALTLLGAKGLALEAANNEVPTLGELARGQLPFTSVALGFRLFGLHEWAGRLMLALWGIVGLSATYALVARLSDRRAGAFAVLALSTTPLFFLHARTILGDMVTMSSIALAVAGLAIAAFDRIDPDQQRAPRRALWLGVGLVGLAAGFGARGVLVGVAVPALAVGLAWLVMRGAGRRDDSFGNVVGVGLLLVGLLASLLGARELALAPERVNEFSMLLGAAVEKQRQLPTHEFVVHHLGHGLLPYSALVPLAAGRMLVAPVGVSGVAFERETSLRATVLIASAAGLAVHGFMAPVTGHLAFGPVFALLVMVALFIRDFERGAPASRTLVMSIAALAILLYTDFKNFPEKGFSAFAVSETRFPESFKESATRLIKYATLGMSAIVFLSLMERQSEASRRFDREEYLRWPRQLRTLWNGNLWFGVLVAEAALAGLALMAYLSDRRLHLKQFQAMGELSRDFVEWGWIALPAVLVAPLAGLLVRDLTRVFYAYVRLTRAAGALLGVVAFGAALSFSYYPALAAQLSPKEVFDAYRRLAASGDKLGMMGVGAGSASYYAGRDVPTFASAVAAFGWLMEASERRWLVIRSSDLPQVNSMYRSRVQPARNLPVLDARSSEILLVSNKLEPGEDNQNPFRTWILDERPKPSHKVDGNFDGKLETLGWDVTTPEGEVVDAVVAGKPYRFVIYYEVQGQISGNWETFIHIDGFQRRYNGDHKTLEGKYPFHLWRKDDFIADVHTFSLEPNFTPGAYNVFYGLFIGNRRLDVKRGRHHENRLEAGTLRVR
jgi:4-amino-4-deoxy-L-arabinose transferase-like glycosyltransferase